MDGATLSPTQSRNPLVLTFGEQGFSTDLRLRADELNTLRQITSSSWLSVIRREHPMIAGQFERIGIERYHELCHLIDHAQLWTTRARTYSAQMVEIIRAFEFFEFFARHCPNYRIGSAMPPYGDLGRARINWRLVRPGADLDLGPIHADYWFDAVEANWSQELTDWVRVKIWIPIFLEPGLTGICYLPGSHRQTLPFDSATAVDGTIKPHFRKADLPQPMQVLPTPIGSVLLFSYNLVHQGANSALANQTRVSMETTLLIPRQELAPLMPGLSSFY